MNKKIKIISTFLFLFFISTVIADAIAEAKGKGRRSRGGRTGGGVSGGFGSNIFDPTGITNPAKINNVFNPAGIYSSILYGSSAKNNDPLNNNPTSQGVSNNIEIAQLGQIRETNKKQQEKIAQELGITNEELAKIQEKITTEEIIRAIEKINNENSLCNSDKFKDGYATDGSPIRLMKWETKEHHTVYVRLVRNQDPYTAKDFLEGSKIYCKGKYLYTEGKKIVYSNDIRTGNKIREVNETMKAPALTDLAFGYFQNREQRKAQEKLKKGK